MPDGGEAVTVIQGRILRQTVEGKSKQTEAYPPSCREGGILHLQRTAPLPGETPFFQHRKRHHHNPRRYDQTGQSDGRRVQKKAAGEI